MGGLRAGGLMLIDFISVKWANHGLQYMERRCAFIFMELSTVAKF